MQCTVITCGGAVDMLTMWNAEHLLRKKKWQWIEDSWLFAQHSRTQSKSKQTPVTKTIRSRRIAVASVLLWLLILQLFSAESRGGRWLDCHWVLLMETSCTTNYRQNVDSVPMEYTRTRRSMKSGETNSIPSDMISLSLFAPFLTFWWMQTMS